MSSAAPMEMASESAARSRALTWVKLAHTWINLDNVIYVEDAEHWLTVYFRVNSRPCLLASHCAGSNEKLYLRGEEAEEMRGYLERSGILLTPPKPTKSPEEW